MENTDLVIDKENNEIELRNFNQVWRLSKLLIKSGLFGTKNRAEVATKIVTGLEIGISPVRAVRHIDTIDGKPSVSAQLSAAMLRMHPNYDYYVEGVSMDGAKVTITYDGEDIGSASFTYDEAKEAGLTNKNNWQNYRRDMLFARAVKRAKKWHAPDVGFGREYMPDELGADETPTVEVPSEVVDEAESETQDLPKGEPNDVDYEEVDKEGGKVDSKSQPQKEPDTQSTKEETTDGSDSTDNFNMQTSTKDEAKSKVEGKTTDKSPNKVSTNTQNGPPHPKNVTPEKEQGTSRYKPYAIPGGIDGIDDKVSQVEYELRVKSGHPEILQSAIERLWDYWGEVKEGEFNERLRDIIETYEKELQDEGQSEPQSDEQGEPQGEPTLENLKSPTQKIIKKMDRNLSKLEGDDLHEQVTNYREEVSQYSDPAKEVALGVIKDHEDRLDSENVSDEQRSDIKRQMKQRAAEWENNLSTAQTILGTKAKEDQTWDTIHDIVYKLDKKSKDYIKETRHKFGKCDLVSEMEDQWAKAVAPYRMIQDIREAIVKGDEIDLDRFNTLLEKFTDEIKSWDDGEKAQVAHDIVHNEVERLDENVEYFNVQKLG